MLSILIPVYNFDVRLLVESLCRQGRAAGITFELICLDDGSTEQFKGLNRRVKQYREVQYEELQHNVGRSRIRNLLAEKARYEYLLLMDCDSALPDENYLQRYIDQLVPGQLLYGGRIYKKEPPDDLSLRLHWAYGIQREQQTAAARSHAPYHSFMTNNFLVPKSILLAIRFEEKLKGYGHEDTLFGFELEKRDIPILHLDNPLYHIGLETAEVLLHKTRQGIGNLLYLDRQPGITIETRLLRLYRRLNKSFLPSAILPILAFMAPAMEAQLKSRRPNMKVFDLLKLYWILKESKDQ